MTLEPGKLYVPASAAEVRDDILTTIRLESIKLGSELAVTPNTDNYILATAIGNAAMLQYANIAAIRGELNPLDAEGAALERWREASGAPPVEETPSAGAVQVEVSGTRTISDGQAFVLPNGLAGHVVGTWIVIDGDEVDVITDDTGEDTELDSGEIVRFVTPPAGVSTEATVSATRPLRGGRGDEGDSQKRDRVLDQIGGDVAGGNWRHIRKIVRDAARVQNVYVYPALGGPSTAKIVPVREYDLKRKDFSRVVDSATLTLIRAAIFSELAGEDTHVIQAAADEPVDVTIQVDIPDSVLAGGSGNGWKDSFPWPPLTGAETTVTVTSVTSSRVVVVDADVTTPPVAGLTHVVWWNPTDMRFDERLVVAQSGSSGSWTITLDRPLIADDGTIVAAGDYICPAAERSADYGKAWVDLMNKIGAGENTSDAELLPRPKRRPLISDEEDTDLTITQLNALQDRFGEIANAAYAARSLTGPSVPGAESTAPNVLVVRRFGVFPL